MRRFIVPIQDVVDSNSYRPKVGEIFSLDNSGAYMRIRWNDKKRIERPGANQDYVDYTYVDLATGRLHIRDTLDLAVARPTEFNSLDIV